MNEQIREGFVDATPVESAAEPQPQTVQDAEDLAWRCPITIKLRRKPIIGNKGEQITELTFREPTAGDLMRAGGNPCRVEVIDVGGGMVTWQPIIDDTKMIRLMASLCGVHEPVLQRMDTRDYSSCSHKLRKFFLPEQGIW